MAKKGTKISKTKKAKKKFEEWEKTGKPEVWTYKNQKKYQIFVPAAGEVFKPCVGSDLKGYYVSNRGNVVSFKNPERPVRMAMEYNNSDRSRYTLNGKHYLSYRLVAEAFEVYAYGLAKRDKTCGVHHVRRYIRAKGRHYNNNPEYLEFLTERVHDLLTKLQGRPRSKRSEQEEKEILQAFAYVADHEEPDRMSIMIDDEKMTGIWAVEKINGTEKARIELAFMVKIMCYTEYFYKYQEGISGTLLYPVGVKMNGGTAYRIYEYDRINRCSKWRRDLSETVQRGIISSMKEIMQSVDDGIMQIKHLREKGYDLIQE